MTHFDQKTNKQQKNSFFFTSLQFLHHFKNIFSDTFE